ncbi:imidazolonepropionase-like amidohydrolase [Rhizomicrobium palustre]|uniref:Imidazolonepropionase-like amidohydrolase n=1 Tax=Rhizomicrobium palustre TaxID=189966 RepID=A0A846MYY5_9PROT|nr:amidohydrolase family protein [Rhizomicrobium palustre]NIK88523.1 imidazolonepropionase-like amidohydrolase [Rhizomicrobium palustre]
MSISRMTSGISTFILAACVMTGSAAAGALKCDRLIDVRSGKILTNQVIQFDTAGVITSVGPSTTVPPDAISIPGKACLPGLIDAHVHLTGDATDHGFQALGVSVPAETIKGVKNARITLEAGFTSARNVGATGFSDVALRDGINAGDVEGPRLLVSGPMVSITGGHGDNNLLPYEYHRSDEGVADGPWALRTKVREIVKYGADLIKISASGGVLSKGDAPGAEQLSLEEMQAIVTEAHKLGRKVAAHAHGTLAIKDAILAGVDSVEHASLIDAEGIKLAKAHGTYLVFDIYNDDYILSEGLKSGMLPESIEKEKKIGRLQRENFKKAFEGGAPMAFGTDAAVYPHGDNAKQFAKMVEWGMKPIDALRAATLNAADLMGWKDKVGEIAPGHFADVIAVDGNPLENVRVLEKVGFVMKGGAVVKNAP